VIRARSKDYELFLGSAERHVHEVIEANNIRHRRRRPNADRGANCRTIRHRRAAVSVCSNSRTLRASRGSAGGPRAVWTSWESCHPAARRAEEWSASSTMSSSACARAPLHGAGQRDTPSTLLLDLAAVRFLGRRHRANIPPGPARRRCMSPCVLFWTRSKKSCGFGVRATAVSTRLFGTLLTWLSDRSSDNFVSAPATTSPNCRRSLAGRALGGRVLFDCLPKPKKTLIWRQYAVSFNPRQSKSAR